MQIMKLNLQKTKNTFEDNVKKQGYIKHVIREKDEPFWFR